MPAVLSPGAGQAAADATGNDEGQEESSPGDVQTFCEKIRQFFGDFQNDEAEQSGDKWDMLYVVNQSFDAMQGLVARQKLAAHPPDRLVSIARNACGTQVNCAFDQWQAAENKPKKCEDQRLFPWAVRVE